MCGFVLKNTGALQGQKRASDSQELVLEDEFSSSPRAESTLNAEFSSSSPRFFFLIPLNPQCPWFFWKQSYLG